MALKGIRAGKLRALGVTSTERLRQLPDVPTIAEAGLAGFQSTVWWGLWAPAGTPSSAVDQLEKDVARAVSATDVQEQLTKRGFEPATMTSAEFAPFVRRDMDAVARIIKEAGIKPK